MIKGTTNLNLVRFKNEVEILTNKFEKSTYDQFLVASIIKNTTNSEEAIEIISAITGKGNLFNFFIGEYNKMIKKYNEKEIESILKNSLIPIIYVRDLKYNYIPTLDITEFDNKIYEKNIFESNDFILNLLDKDETFVKSTFSNKAEKDKYSDNYEFIIDNDVIRIKFNNSSNKYFEINKLEFQKNLIQKLSTDISKLTIIKKLENCEGQVNLLNDGDIKLIENSITITYKNKIIMFYDDYVKKIAIYYDYRAYWIEENKLFYNEKKNRQDFTEILNLLLENKRFNEIKNKIIARLISSTDSLETKLNTLNKLLVIKDSPEIAKLALDILVENKGEIKFNWDIRALEAIYKYHDNVIQLIEIYNLNNELNYNILELNDIHKKDKTILNKKHKDELNDYLNDVNSLEKEINEILGKMSQSGMREELKKHKMNDKLKKLKNFYNKVIAHKNPERNEMDLEKLRIKLNNIREMEKIHDDFYNIVKTASKKIKKNKN